MHGSHSSEAYVEALNLFPGGVNSPVRAFKNVNSQPFFVQSAKGSTMTDIDGNTYIDYVQSWGPMILGHCPEAVLEAVTSSLQEGWTYGAPCIAENKLAQKVKQLIPSIEMMRFVSSGTEAAMGAIRLARGVTNKNIIVKCDGGYHGHSDGLLVNAGSGLATFGTSSSAGIPENYTQSTIVIPMNDTEALRAAFDNYPGQIAGFILEPIAGNTGVILPKKDYLKTCKEICHKNEALLIFDEVMCGFRAHMGGAQRLYQIEPDITVLGKVIGGGFPVGAYGASKKLMQHVAPNGPIYQAGTLSGNPVAMTAGLKTLELLENGKFAIAEKQCKLFMDLIEDLLNTKSIAHQINQVGTMFSVFLQEGPFDCFQDVAKIDKKQFSIFHKTLLQEGVFFAPSHFEAGFMSSEHSIDDLEKSIDAIKKAISAI